jgi:hypothetical protein
MCSQGCPHTHHQTAFLKDVCKHVLTGVPPHASPNCVFETDVCKHVLTGVPPHASPNCAFESQCKHPMPAKQHRLFQLDENSTYQTCHRTCSGASARQSAAEIAQTIPRRLHITGQHQNSVHPTFHSARFMTFNLFQHKRHQPPHLTLRTAVVCCARTPPHHRTASKLSTPNIPQRTFYDLQLVPAQTSSAASPDAAYSGRLLRQDASTSPDSIKTQYTQHSTAHGSNIISTCLDTNVITRLTWRCARQPVADPKRLHVARQHQLGATLQIQHTHESTPPDMAGHV